MLDETGRPRVDTRSDTVQLRLLKDRHEHGALVGDALNGVQERFPLRAVRLFRLLLEQLVDLGIRPGGELASA